MPSPGHAIYELRNPFRSPAWRAERAQYLANHKPNPKLPSRHLDDQYTKDYRSFLLRWNDGEEERRKLYYNNPALYYSHVYSLQPDEEWRAMLDAYILARCCDEYIAYEFNILPDTVHYYETLHFNVRDRLEARAYIAKTVLGPSFSRSLEYNETITQTVRHNAYRLFGYAGGPFVLDAIISGFQDDAIPAKPDQAAEWLDTAVKSSLRAKSAIAAQFFVVNKFNVMQLFEITQRYMQSDREARLAAGGAGGDYTANVEKFLEGLPVSVGAEARRHATPQMLEYEKSAVEPNVEEQYALAAGRVPVTLQHKLTLHQPPAEETGT